TATGTSALGVIRISGPRALEICSMVFKGASPLTQKSHSIHYGYIQDDKKILDEVMISIFKGKKSFTAEDTVEISCHGSGFILESILKLLIKQGARTAEPGEFSLRAYLNGRIDLTQAEAVADLIASENE